MESPHLSLRYCTWDCVPSQPLRRKVLGQDRPSGDYVPTVIPTTSTLHSTSHEQPVGTYAYCCCCCCCQVTSVVSDSMRPHRQQPMRLPRPWDSPGKNTGVGCHFLLQCMKVKSESEVTQSCLTLCDPMDCSPPGSPSMGVSRQEYWSGVPLPPPHLVIMELQIRNLNERPQHTYYKD